MDTKLLSEFLSKAVKVRRLIEHESSFEDKAVTLLQMQALIFIYENPKTPVGSLADVLSMSISSVTQLTNRLADAGFIKRETHSSDRRIICLSITQNGNKQIKIFRDDMQKSHFKVFSKIPESDIKEMIRIFSNILESQKNIK